MGGDTSMAKLANATIPVEEASIQRSQLTVESTTKKASYQSLYKQIVEEDVMKSHHTGPIKALTDVSYVFSTICL